MTTPFLRGAWAVLALLSMAGARAQSPASSAPTAPPAGVAPADAEASTSFSYVSYRADYQVNPDYTSEETDRYEILIKTRAGADRWSQVRLGYSEKMQALDVLEAYTLTADGQRHDVAQDRIYTQESYSSASAAMYADRKVKVIVFPNLAPGSRLVYTVRQRQTAPYFAGYFGLWETFSRMTQFDRAEVDLKAPAGMALHIQAQGMQGGALPASDGQQHWHWTLHDTQAMPVQNWTLAPWEYSPTIMVSSFAGWGQMGLAYQAKAGPAAQVTPAVQQQADAITAGLADRRAQAQAIYDWVAGHIRYVAVYLGNGGLEPNSADMILANRYGDCKDHTVVLEALLAAKGIASSPVLIGANAGPTLPQIAVLGRFNHAITWVPEFGLYLDSTSPFARFGQLPASDLGAPVVHTLDGSMARTPAAGPDNSAVHIRASFDFRDDGSVSGRTDVDAGASGEIAERGGFAQLTAQTRQRVQDSIMASSGFDGTSQLVLDGVPTDLTRPFGFHVDFQASDYADLSVLGAMNLPDPPGADSIRDLYKGTSSPQNLTPFQCNAGLHEETYVLRFPQGVPLIAVPQGFSFTTQAGTYQVQWSRQDQVVTAVHRLQLNAVRGPDKPCQPQDYPSFRQLYQQVRRGFRAQVLYGDLAGARGR